MSLAPTAISVIDPHDTDSRAVDWAAALPTGDSLSSVAVSIVAGTCELAATVSGTYATTASATVSGTESQVWIKSATAGTLQLLWRATCASGRVLDLTTTLAVQSR